MYYLILNPVAGGGRLSKIQHKLKYKLSSLNLLGEFMKTSGEGDAENLARIAVNKGYQTIICVGGDSTVNEVINGIAGADVTLGIIPIGYNNVFAKHLSIPINWQDSLSVISARNIDGFDLGKIIERHQYFVISAGLGAEISLCLRSRDQGISTERLLFGDSSLFASILQETSPVEMRFIVDKQYSVSVPVLSASFINSSFIKDGFCGDVSFLNSDGLLDLLIISPTVNKKNYLKMVKSKEPWRYNFVTRLKGREIHVESFGDQMKIHVDGRILTKTPVTIRVAPARQKIIIGKICS